MVAAGGVQEILCRGGGLDPGVELPEGQSGIALFGNRAAQFLNTENRSIPVAVLNPDLFVGLAERKRIVTCKVEEHSEETSKYDSGK